jgi:hypothetical protein
MDEGVVPSVATGMVDLADVRGDSGTSVTLYLQPAHFSLTDPSALLPMLTKILETTQYTFAVQGVLPQEEEKAIIQASENEKQMLEELQQQQEQDVDDEDSNMDVSSVPKKRPLMSDEEYNSVKERAKYIPLRLNLKERKLLRLVEAAMNCCEYTSMVDQTFKSTTRRLHQQLQGVTSVLRGLVTGCDYAAGQKLASGETSYEEYQTFLRKVLEIARRHKIMNPEKMRTEYGKLVCLLQDAVRLQQDGHLDGVLSQSLIAPIQTVYRFLEFRQGLAVLEDTWIEVAAEEILAGGKTRAKIDAEIGRKENAVKRIQRTYSSQWLSENDIHLCLYSICDNNSFLNSNRVPIDKVIRCLRQQFSPTRMDHNYSLAIIQGKRGARLSHSHERQYYFALQSLTLWRDIVNDMFRLWAMAESDLLSPSVSYNLQDTGQGIQRVQQSPQTYQAMQEILRRVQQKVQQWVGSSVIHLGDHNVPNALSFIDKYTQGTYYPCEGREFIICRLHPLLWSLMCLIYFSPSNSGSDCGLLGESGETL